MDVGTTERLEASRMVLVPSLVLSISLESRSVDVILLPQPGQQST